MTKKKLRFPNPILKELNRSRSRVVTIKKFYDFSFNDIHTLNTERIKENKSIAIFPNAKKFFVPVIKREDSKVEKLIGVKTKESEYFLEYVDSRNPKLSEYCLSLNTYMGTIGDTTVEVFTPDELECGKLYYIEALEYNVLTGREDSRAGTTIVCNKYIATTTKLKKDNFSDIRNLRFNSIHDLALVWDYNHDSYIFDEIEMTIILCALVYAEEDVDAMNLRISGETESKKSALLTVIEWITGDPVVPLNSTIKGLVPSFYKGNIKAGAMMDSKVCCCVDELFRLFTKEHDYRVNMKNTIHDSLLQIMNVIDRRQQKYSSGTVNYYGIMRASFIATDNRQWDKYLKEIWKIDKPCLRRFSFLSLSPSTEKRAQAGYTDIREARDGLSARMGRVLLTLSKYRRFILMLREECTKIKVDRERLASKMKVTSTHPHMLTKAIAVEKFVTALRRFIPSTPENRTEEVLSRLTHDFNTTVFGHETQNTPQGATDNDETPKTLTVV